MIFQILLAILSLALIFIFSAYETAFLVVQRKGFVGLSPSLQRFLRHVDSVFATILVGINLFGVTASITTFGALQSVGMSSGKAIALSGTMISLLILLMEFTAKALSRKFSTVVVSTLTPLVKVFSYFAVPINQLVLTIIFPIRALKKESSRDKLELLQLLVTESLIDGELDSEKAETILNLTRTKSMKMEEIAEPVDKYLVEQSEEAVMEKLKRQTIILVKTEEGIKLLDKKLFFLTQDLVLSLSPLPEVDGHETVEQALKILKDKRTEALLVKTKRGIKVFLLKNYLKNLIGA